ncbi:MAG: outer membrane protein assembly factor BamD [Coxiellaceae bacterium]|nr:outer membrane protein assembly factor BamD [Coxiellaceae bacterium]
MKISKILFWCFCALIISACSIKDYSPNNFKNYNAKQILIGGEKAITKRDYGEAVKYFEAIDALYPFDPESQQGQLDVIYAYYKAGDHASAIAAANRYIHLYPEGEHADYAYYMKGIVSCEKEHSFLHRFYPRQQENLDVSNLREAFFSFSDLVKKFPQSIYAQDAEKRMLYIRNMLAQHELYIAKFYFDRRAYIAATNRASQIVKHYGGVPQVKEALKVMIKSYRVLGANKQAYDAERIFNLNFPKKRI